MREISRYGYILKRIGYQAGVQVYTRLVLPGYLQVCSLVSQSASYLF